MPYTPTPQELAESLHEAGGLKLKRVRHLQGRMVVMTCDWQGQEIQFTTTINEVLSGTIPDMPQRRGERAHLGRASHQRYYEQALIEEDCRRLEIPLYYSEGWLRRMKEQHGTFTAIHAAHPDYSESTLAYAAKKFGWPPEKPVRDEALKEAVRADRAAGMTLKELAKKHGISLGTASEWTKELSR